jgi:hypothetical protein
MRTPNRVCTPHSPHRPCPAWSLSTSPQQPIQYADGDESVQWVTASSTGVADWRRRLPDPVLALATSTPAWATAVIGTVDGSVAAHRNKASLPANIRVAKITSRISARYCSPMALHPLARRLLGTAGFALAALCFALPFLTISYTVSGTGFREMTTSFTYTGADLAVGGSPEITWHGMTQDDLPEALRSEEDLEDPEGIDPRPLLALAMGASIAGAGAIFLRTRWARAAAAAGSAGIALIFLVGGHFGLVAETWSQVGGSHPDFRFGVSTGYGFWLAGSVLLVLLLAHGYVLIRQRRRPHVDDSPSLGRAGI